MQIKFFIILVIISILFVPSVYSKDGVYVSGGRPPVSDKVESLLKEYAQQVVYNVYLEMITDVVKRMTSRNETVNLMPAIILMSIHQIASHGLENDEIRQHVYDAYKKSHDLAISQYKEGHAQSLVQSRMKYAAEKEILPLEDNRVFRFVVEEILTQAVGQQRKIVAQQMIQQYMQQAVIQQKTLENRLQQQYQQSIQSLLVP